MLNAFPSAGSTEFIFLKCILSHFSLQKLTRLSEKPYRNAHIPPLTTPRALLQLRLPSNWENNSLYILQGIRSLSFLHPKKLGLLEMHCLFNSEGTVIGKVLFFLVTCLTSEARTHRERPRPAITESTGTVMVAGGPSTITCSDHPRLQKSHPAL